MRSIATALKGSIPRMQQSGGGNVDAYIRTKVLNLSHSECRVVK